MASESLPNRSQLFSSTTPTRVGINTLPKVAPVQFASTQLSFRCVKAPLLAMSLLLASGPVYGEWELIGVSDIYKANVYVDYAAVRRTGNVLTMLELFDYESKHTLRGPKVYLSHMTEREYDCPAELTRVLAVKWYSGHMGSGTMIDSLNLISNWTIVERGSIAEALWFAACGLSNERK